MGVSKIGVFTPKMDDLQWKTPMNKWMIRGYHYFWKYPFENIQENLRPSNKYNVDVPGHSKGCQKDGKGCH